MKIGTHKNILNRKNDQTFHGYVTHYFLKCRSNVLKAIPEKYVLK